MPSISRANAIRQIRYMQEKNVSSEVIHQNMMAFGFSYLEINEMIASREQRKRKNHFHYESFERGGWLSVYLAIPAVALVGLNFVLFMNWQNDFDGEYGNLFLFTFIVAAVISGIILICILGLWNGKRFGYHGLLAMMIIMTILGMLTATAIPIIVGTIVILTLGLLVESKAHLLN